MNQIEHRSSSAVHACRISVRRRGRGTVVVVATTVFTDEGEVFTSPASDWKRRRWQGAAPSLPPADVRRECETKKKKMGNCFLFSSMATLLFF
nr:hypothetical protein Itr_chr02CG09230 [Ipomoea trifida]